MAGDRAAENLARNAAAARAWFATIVEAVETRDKKLEVQIGNIPSMFITAVMTCTKTYGGLELTVLQRATLSGNSAAVLALKAVDSKLLGADPIRLAGVRPHSWESELRQHLPAFVLPILELCSELDWLHLAVLSGDTATVRIVHRSMSSVASSSSPLTPALLSLFAQPTWATLAKVKAPFESPPSTFMPIPLVVVGEACSPEFVRDAWSLAVALSVPDHLFQIGWQLAILSFHCPGARPFQIQTHLSLMPAMLPSISFKGLEVGRPKLALDQLWPPLGLLAAAKPELCSPHWRTELAFQEEGGLAPMFRAVLEGHTHNLATLCAYIDQDHGDPYVVLDFPRIKAGRYQGYSPVLFAAARGLLATVSFLVTSLHGSLEDQTPDGSTVLHLLMDNWRGSPELSTTQELDEEEPDDDGSCEAVVPRLMDSWERELDIMLKVGDAPIPLAQRLAAQNQHGSTPLHMAARHTVDPRMAALLQMLKAETATAGSQEPLEALLGVQDKDGQNPLMVWMAHHVDLPPPYALLPGVLDEGSETLARRAAEAVLGRIPDDLLLRLLGQQDALGRTCLWLLFKQTKPAPARDKALAVAKLQYLADRFAEQPKKRMQELCSLHQRPVQLQPEQQAADRKLLEELQVPLIHAWQLDGGKGYRDGKQGLFDASLLRVCLKWGLNFSSPDGQGRTLLYSACMEQNTDIVNALAGDVHLLETPDNSGLLPLGLAVAWNYLDVARTVLQVPDVMKLSHRRKMAMIDDGSRQSSAYHAPLHTAIINEYTEMLQLLQEHGLSLAEARPEYLQVEEARVLKCSERTPQAWFESSLMQCAASMGQKQALGLILQDFHKHRAQGAAEQQRKQALQAAITAAVDLPGLLGEESTAAVGQHAPAKPDRPAWEHSVALRAQLGQTGSPQTGPEHLDCVRVLLQQGAGLQLSQLLQAQATCAALRERKVKHPLGRLFERRTLHACGACSLYGLWHVCSCCRKQHYCSPACQRAHLPQHLSQCKPVAKCPIDDKPS